MNLKRLFKRKPRLFMKCNELPIHNFNEVATNDDLNFLKKNMDDKVSEIDLQNAWLGILDEFIRISKNMTAISMLKKKTTLTFLDKRLQVFEAIKINMQLGNDVTAVCKEYRVKKDKIDAHIGLVKNDMNTIKSSIPDEENNSRKSESTEFDRSIAVILKAGYHINRFTTVVSEWCAILNLLEKAKTAA